MKSILSCTDRKTILAGHPALLSCCATRNPVVSPRSTSKRIMSGLWLVAASTAVDPEDKAPTISKSDWSRSNRVLSISGLSSTHRSLFTSNLLVRSEDYYFGGSCHDGGKST